MTPHRFRQLASRAALVACLAVGVIACGDDDDDSDATAEDTGGDTGGTDEQAAGGDPCEAIVEFNGAATQLDTSSMDEAEMKAAGEELRDTWDPIAQDPPDDVAEDVEGLTSALDDLAAGDSEAFDSDETFETYTMVVGAVVEDCDFEALEATAVDYAFEGVPETVPAGTVALNLTNEGEELHEMIIFQKPEGDTRSPEELLNDPAMEESGPPPAGFTFAAPGETGTGLAQLEAGSYFAVCFIPLGSTPDAEEPAEGDESGPPHFTQGMVAEFTVE